MILIIKRENNVKFTEIHDMSYIHVYKSDYPNITMAVEELTNGYESIGIETIDDAEHVIIFYFPAVLTAFVTNAEKISFSIRHDGVEIDKG